MSEPLSPPSVVTCCDASLPVPLLLLLAIPVNDDSATCVTAVALVVVAGIFDCDLSPAGPCCCDVSIDESNNGEEGSFAAASAVVTLLTESDDGDFGIDDCCIASSP